MTWEFPKLRKLEQGSSAVCLICGASIALSTRDEPKMCAHAYRSMSIECVDGAHAECVEDIVESFTFKFCVCICHQHRTEEEVVTALRRIEQELSQ